MTETAAQVNLPNLRDAEDVKKHYLKIIEREDRVEMTTALGIIRGRLERQYEGSCETYTRLLEEMRDNLSDLLSKPSHNSSR